MSTRTLSEALAGATRGDGSALLELVDGYLHRRPDGGYGNLMEVYNAVICLDKPTPDVSTLRAQASRFNMASPMFGTTYLTSLFVCAHWPVQAKQEPVPRASGAAPVLVVDTRGDPATPYSWAEALSQQLESAVLLTYEGEGHTAYARSIPCIDEAIEAYLVDGKVPEDGKRCTSETTNTESNIMLNTASGGRQP